MNIPTKSRRPAFTLIEMTIVMAIIGILAAMAMSVYATALSQSKAHRTRALDVIVIHFDIGFPVERDGNVLAREVDAKRMPSFGGHGCVNVLECDPASALGVVERNVVLERVGPRDVVAVAVFPAPHHAPGLVLLAAERLELHLDIAVLDQDVVQHAPRKRSRQIRWPTRRPVQRTRPVIKSTTAH